MHGWGFVLAIMAIGIAAVAFATTYVGRFHPVLVASGLFGIVAFLVTLAVGAMFGGLFIPLGLMAGAYASLPAIIGATAGRTLLASKKGG
jgi:hypothetical protein